MVLIQVIRLATPTMSTPQANSSGSVASPIKVA